MNQLTADERRVIRGAALAIREYGHVKGYNGNRSIGVCLNGAIKIGLGIDTSTGLIPDRKYELYRSVCNRLRDRVHEIAPEAGGWIHWNDLPTTTPDLVLELLDGMLKGDLTTNAR